MAAQSLGIGSCYIGDIMENCELHRRMLRLAPFVFPAAMVVFGYPTKQQQSRQKPERCEIGHIVHENAYRPMAGPELRQMLRKKPNQQSYEQWCEAFCERKYNSEFSREMTRSVRRYLEGFDG
mgnify:CR=1 FL=1